MSTVEPTDLFLVNRAGTNYTVPFSALETLQDTDLLPVSRGGVTYQATGAQFKSAQLLDTDLLLVSRSSTTYVVPFIDAKLTSSAGEQVFVTPGTSNWVVPAGVSKISLVAVGGGSSGTYGSGTFPGAGGGGGGLVWANDLSVTPGETLTVVVGAGGQGGTSSSTTAQNCGNHSSVTRSGQWSATAHGGGDTAKTNSLIGGHGAVTGITTAFAIHTGGNGQNGQGVSPYPSGGGGGAAGYTAYGRSGGTSTGVTDGGSGGERLMYGGAGGGVGLRGSVPNTPTLFSVGGSRGTDGIAASATGEGIRHDGGSYGGGGAGGRSSSYLGGLGGQGAVRIIWGGNRSFPNNADELLGLSSVTLLDAPGGARFTNVAFPLGVTATGAGTTLQLKAWVRVQDREGAVTDTIADLTDTTLVYSATGFTGPWSKNTGNTVAGTAKSPSAIFNGSANISDYASPDSTSESCFWDPTSFGLVGPVSMIISGSSTPGQYGIKVNGTQIITSSPSTTMHYVTYPGKEPITSMEFYRGATGSNLRIHSINDLEDGEVVTRITFSSTKQLTEFSIGDSWTTAGGASGTVLKVDVADSKLTVKVTGGTLAVGDTLVNSRLTVPVGPAEDYYLDFVASGSIASTAPVAADPGFRAWTPPLISENYWSGNLKFPALFGSTAPDTLFPAQRSSLHVLVKLSDASGASVQAGASVLPA